MADIQPKRKHLAGRVLAWLGKAFKNVIHSAGPVAVTITEAVKAALTSQATGFLAKLIDDLSGSHIAEDVLKVAQPWITKLLAAELAITELPDNPTEQDILDFERRALDAFNVHPNHSKLYTVFGAQLYGIVQKTFGETPEKPPTFAEWVKALQEAYDDYLADKAAYPDE